MYLVVLEIDLVLLEPFANPIFYKNLIHIGKDWVALVQCREAVLVPLRLL